MQRSPFRWRLAAMGTAVGALVAATPLLAGPRTCPTCTRDAGRFGPPWISVEIPPNPFDAASRGAFLLVHTYHHGEPASARIAGTAQGVTDGGRRTLPLTFTSTSRPGVYALRRQWPSDGRWVLVISSSDHPGDSVTALVSIGANGGVTKVDVPTVERGDAVLPRAVSQADVERLLGAGA